MATAQSPLLPGEALFNLSSQQWSDWNDPFEVMPEYELDFWVDEFAPSDVQQQSSESQDSSGQHAIPASSSSPEDSNGSNAQFTPSSTADDSPGDGDHASFEIVPENTNSPGEDFDEASLVNSDFSSHSPVSQRVMPASGATFSPSQQSREPSNGPTRRSERQDWSSSFTSSSDGYPPAASPYNGFVTAESTSAFNNNLLADMAIPFRISQPSEPWATTVVQSSTWGNLQQPMFPMQQQSFANFMPYQMNDNMGNFPLQTIVGNSSNIHSGLTIPGPPYHAQPQHTHHPPPLGQIIHNTPQQPVTLPGHTIHSRQQHIAPLPTSTGPPQLQPSSVRADLAQSTRLRFPDHPKLSAEQNPSAPRPSLRPIAVASGERNSTALSSRGAQSIKQRRGGRERHSHLNPDARDRSSKMRKKGACWRCKLQRDPVSSIMFILGVTFADDCSAPTTARLAGGASLDHRRANSIFSTAIGQSSRTSSWTFCQRLIQPCIRSRTSRIA